MRALSLQLLTWGTAAAAISSAVWLSSTDQASVFCSISYRATSEAMGMDLDLPAAPTGAGPSSAIRVRPQPVASHASS